jgi:hypothetical protein
VYVRAGGSPSTVRSSHRNGQLLPGSAEDRLRERDAHSFSLRAPQFRGCPFINLATEIPDREHPGAAIARANKQELRRRLHELSRDLGARDPRRPAEQLALIIDGERQGGASPSHPR